MNKTNVNFKLKIIIKFKTFLDWTTKLEAGELYKELGTNFE